MNEFLGQDKPKRPFAQLAPLIAIAAQAYHGGYNVAPALGFSPEEKGLADLDIRSAYPTALSFIALPDWRTARHCTDLDHLAVIDTAMTAALVEFRFPNETRFPCLPVRALSDRGLIHPLEGISWCTGPELVCHRHGCQNHREGWLSRRLDTRFNAVVRGHRAADQRNQG